MKILPIVAALISLQVSFVAAASLGGGHVVGNGGDVAVCRTASGERIELLDYVEARTLYPRFRIDLGPSSMTIEQKVERAISRLDFHSPIRASLYRKLAKSLLESDPFIDKSLEDIQDSDHMDVVIPEGCHVEQIAVQLSGTLSPKDKRYLINRSLWQRLDRDQRAGLVLHEIIYTEALSYGHKTSKQVRKINSHLADGSVSTFTDGEIFQFFAAADFQNIELRGSLVNLWDDIYGSVAPSFYDHGGVREVFVVKDSGFLLRSQGVPLRIRNRLRFDEDGQPILLTLSRSAQLKTTRNQLVLFPALTTVTLDKFGRVTTSELKTVR